MRVLVTTMLLLCACAKSDPSPANVPPAPSATTMSTPSAAPPASSAATTADPVARLVAKLSASPLWINGTFPTIELPATTPVPQVVATVFTKVSFETGSVKTHRVVSTKDVTIGSETKPYTAAVVETDQGPMVVLLRHDTSGWWSRVFPANEP